MTFTVKRCIKYYERCCSKQWFTVWPAWKFFRIFCNIFFHTIMVWMTTRKNGNPTSLLMQLLVQNYFHFILTVLQPNSLHNPCHRTNILRYTNADLKISLYVCVYIKTILWKFRFFSPKNGRVICTWSL